MPGHARTSNHRPEDPNVSPAQAQAGRVPRLRHHPARRLAAGGPQPLGADKLAIAALLDELGVDFIEGGWPGANPNDTSFFAAMADGALRLKNAELVAFGFTRRVGMKAADDPLTAAAARLARTGRLHRGQEPRPACRAGAAHHAGREPGDDHRHGAAPSRRGSAGLRRLRALLRRLPGEPGVRAGGRAHRGRGRRRGRRALRHQRRHAAAVDRRDRDGRRAKSASSSASTPTTTPAARSPTPWPRSTPVPCTCRAP